jgi:DNA-directed RNA polymerase subunit N (RpoN/RPB10)
VFWSKEIHHKDDRSIQEYVDTSKELDEEGIKKYQTMIRCLQWAFSWIIKSIDRHKKRHIICCRREMITNDIAIESLKSVPYFTLFNYCFGSNIHGDMIFLTSYSKFTMLEVSKNSTSQVLS